MYERRTEPLLARRAFYRRQVKSLGFGVVILGVALGIGMAGYHYFEKLSWLDAYLNASMILSGMGPVATLQTGAGKFFAGSYALFSGLAFITTVGVIFAPAIHRFLHRFHLERMKKGDQ
jgi:hypothetical protein